MYENLNYLSKNEDLGYFEMKKWYIYGRDCHLTKHEKKR